MKKSLFIVLMSAMIAAPAFAEEAAPAAPAAVVETAAPAATAAVTAQVGQTVVAAGGVRLGRVLRLADDGSPRLISEGHMLTVPLSSLTLVDGRLVSSLTRAQINAAN